MKGVCVLIAALMLAACSALPVIQAVPASDKKTGCPSQFTSEPRRFIHTIEAQAAGKTQAVMIGVTLLNPQTRMISSAIVSAEGLSLFEAASFAGDVKVSRALPPFDAPDFARNMMEDIDLIFLAPAGAPESQGVLAGGRAVCRWHRENGGWVDVSDDADGRIRIQRYTQGGALKRSVTLTAAEGNAYASIHLQASGLIHYTLIMTLLESEAVAPQTENKLPAN